MTERGWDKGECELKDSQADRGRTAHGCRSEAKGENRCYRWSSDTANRKGLYMCAWWAYSENDSPFLLCRINQIPEEWNGSPRSAALPWRAKEINRDRGTPRNPAPCAAT